MAIMAETMPILPGKKEMWLKLMDQVTVEPGRTEFLKSRGEAEVRERSFFQEGPDGDFVILTFEGKYPETSGAKIISSSPDEFKAVVKEMHGLDVSGPAPTNKLIIDS